jgi:hypothetical protein
MAYIPDIHLGNMINKKAVNSSMKWSVYEIVCVCVYHNLYCKLQYNSFSIHFQLLLSPTPVSRVLPKIESNFFEFHTANGYTPPPLQYPSQSNMV